MTDFLEFDDQKKTINSLNLDDFSVVDLEKYIKELKTEIKRTEAEIIKKNVLLNAAEKFFK